MGTNATQIPMSSAVRHDSASPVAPYRTQPWYLAYMDALFESDRTRMAERIKYAEQLILRRERELFPSRTEMTEQRALAGALHALRALRSCFGIRA
jgi:hypothetical protein